MAPKARDVTLGITFRPYLIILTRTMPFHAGSFCPPTNQDRLTCQYDPLSFLLNDRPLIKLMQQNRLPSDEEPNLQQPETNQARCNHVSFFEKLIM